MLLQLQFAAISMLIAIQGSMVGDFKFAVGHDPINDSKQVIAELNSGRSQLTIGCDYTQGHGITVTFETGHTLANMPLLLKGLMPFAYRIDQNPAESGFSTYGQTAAILTNAEARAFAERLASGSSVYVRVQGLSGEDLDAQFFAAKANDAIQRVADECQDTKLLKRLARHS